MTNLEAMISSPVPPVEATDLQRVFTLMVSVMQDQAASTGGTEPPAIGFDVSIIARECSAGSNPEATSMRAILLYATLSALDDWRTGGGLDSIVFETMAAFPLPDGAQSFDGAAFIEELRGRSA